jgi:hypothetical protein
LVKVISKWLHLMSTKFAQKCFFYQRTLSAVAMQNFVSTEYFLKVLKLS